MNTQIVRSAAVLFCLVPLLAITGCDEIMRQLNNQANNAAPGNAAPANAPAQQGAPAAGQPAQFGQPQPAQPAFAQAAGKDPYADLYGDQGGEQVLAASNAPFDAPLRARKGDVFFRLSNPRVGQGRFGFPTLTVEYEIIRSGEHGGQSMILRSSEGRTQTVMLMGPMFQKTGKIEVEERFPSFAGGGLPQNMEIYMIRSEYRYGFKSHPLFKVSNSVVVGTMPNQTLARGWTAEEAAKLRLPPPNYSNPNAHPNVGHDTKFVGDTEGGGLFRFVDPEKPMLGIEYTIGAWDNEKSIGQLVGVFDRDQPVTHQPRIIARDGYAIGGINVRSHRYVNAIQVVFMKVGSDGALEPNDSYSSDWIGEVREDSEPVALGGDGRAVIGLHCRSGAILNALALVMKTSGVR